MSSLPVPATSDPAAPDRATLEAFAVFNPVSRQLEESYRDLERETARMRVELRNERQRGSAENRRSTELSQRLSAVLEALPGAVLLLDGEDKVQGANRAATQLFGELSAGMPWAALRERAFAAAGGADGDLVLRDGRRLSLAQKSLRPGPGRVLLLTDITEKRKIEDLLARHRRLATLGEMAAALAHQVRTPLAAGLLYATSARRAGLPAEQRDALLAKAISCLHDLERLISDMLQFARGATLTGNPFSLDELLDSVEIALRPMVLPGQALNITRAQHPITLAGNRETLAGALLNLATNALNAGGAAAAIEIVARRSGIQAEIAVVDNGPGIPAPLRERIFDPFFSSRPEGTGLGLPVARSIARAHRGDVVLTDGSPGHATFALRIPIAAPDSTEPAAGQGCDLLRATP